MVKRSWNLNKNGRNGKVVITQFLLIQVQQPICYYCGQLRMNILKQKMVVLTPACTWATNISTMIQFGIEFVVGDNDLFDFGISENL